MRAGAGLAVGAVALGSPAGGAVTAACRRDCRGSTVTGGYGSPKPSPRTGNCCLTHLPLPATGEKRHRAAGGRRSDGAFSAAVGKHEDQRKPDVFSGHRKVEEVSRSDGEGPHSFQRFPLSGASASSPPAFGGASQESRAHLPRCLNSEFRLIPASGRRPR